MEGVHFTRKKSPKTCPGNESTWHQEYLQQKAEEAKTKLAKDRADAFRFTGKSWHSPDVDTFRVIQLQAAGVLTPPMRIQDLIGHTGDCTIGQVMMDTAPTN